MPAGTCALTGAHGFVGSRLQRQLQAHGWRVVPWTRQPQPGADSVAFRLGEPVDPALLRGVDALVHCAYDFKPLRWQDIHSVNVTGSRQLFLAARQAGVKSIVFISSLSAFEGCRSLYGKAKLEIEALAQSVGGFILRPGLVYSDHPGGMFGRLVHQVRNARVVPALWGGRQTQYLVQDADLGNLVRGCLDRRVPAGSGPVAVANDRGWELKDIMREIARVLGKRISFVPVPWQCLWVVLKSLELAGVPARFRSDSLISMVYQDPAPPFAVLKSLGFQCRRLQLTSAMLGDTGG